MTKRINFLYKILSNIRNRHFFILDVILLLFTTLFTAFIMARGNIYENISSQSLLIVAFTFLGVKILIYSVLGLYRQLWRYASIDDLARLMIIGFVTMVVQGLFSHYLLARYVTVLKAQFFYFPYFDAIISIIFVSFTRFSVRLVARVRDRNNMKLSKGNLVLIAGAGKSGITISDEMQSNYDLDMIPVAFVDDDPQKKSMKIRGIPVLGTIDDITAIVSKHNIDSVVIAMPTASGKVYKKIVSECDKIGINTLTVPGIYEILNGNVSLNTIREIRIEDLLRRAPVETDTNVVSENIKGKTVLVTGAGGSIGSELCRQVFNLAPKKMILVGHGENSIFDIDGQLKRKANALFRNGKNRMEIIPIIADLRFRRRVESIFEQYRPDLVFHAAAHKHVPLMEDNPVEAITNNVLGTKNLVDMSVKYGVEKFVGISTDKAVNPTNIMGASKRMSEMIILNAARKTGKYFSAVRFGNVLGSRGSVVRTFKKQIHAGGPITITHPEINRFFMTIPEAVQLVMQASVLGRGGNIFVLDMGEPVKILDLAHDMIKLAGLIEGEDIEIAFTGLRPGEKLYEELFIEGENYSRTIHSKIFIADNASSMLSDNLEEQLDELIGKVEDMNRQDIIYNAKEIVPEYNPNNELLQTA